MIKPTEAELEILRILWLRGPLSVRVVNDVINESKDSGYTTTLKTMQIMTQKGLVARDESSRTHIYRALIGKDKVQTVLLDKLMDTAFGGSASQLVLNALGRGSTSQKELEEIKALIKKLEDGNQ